jgi:hypothetical protein
MPKFIYKITIILLVIIGLLYLLLNELNPDLIINKIFISIVITIILTILLPLLSSLYIIFINRKKPKEDLNIIFKNIFKKTLILSFFLGFIFFLRLSLGLDYKYLFLILVSPLFIKFALKRLGKSRKKSKY